MPTGLRLDRIISGLLLFAVFAALSAAEDNPKKDVPAEECPVPVDLENWKIEFDGIEDQPRRPFQFHVSLSHDGTMLVEKWRGEEERQKAFEGKLTSKETRRFFDRTAKIINEYDKEKSDGNRADMWNVSLGISGKKYSKKVTFIQQKEVSDRCAPGFSEIVEIIRGSLLKESGFPH